MRRRSSASRSLSRARGAAGARPRRLRPAARRSARRRRPARGCSSSPTAAPRARTRSAMHPRLEQHARPAAADEVAATGRTAVRQRAQQTARCRIAAGDAPFGVEHHDACGEVLEHGGCGGELGISTHPNDCLRENLRQFAQRMLRVAALTRPRVRRRRRPLPRPYSSFTARPSRPVVRALYGNMCRSRFGASRVTSIDCWRVYLRMPPAPWRVPRPRGLPAAHRQLEREVVQLRVVDADGARVDAPRDLLAARDVLRPHRRREPVGRVVGEPDRLLGVLHAHDRQRRAERLLGHARHRVVDVGEHRRLVEAPAACAPGRRRARVAPALARLVDVAGDDLELRRERHRADVHAARARPAGPGAARCTFSETLRTKSS